MKQRAGSIVMIPRNFCPPKRVSTPKWAQIAPKLIAFGFSGGDTLKSCVQSKFHAERWKIAPFMTDRTFWDPKLPHSHRPI